MVRLGYTKDAKQCPSDFHAVRFEEGAVPDGSLLATSVCSWPERRKGQRFELVATLPPGGKRPGAWAGELGRVLAAMGWERWRLDTFSLVTDPNRYLTDVLKEFGFAFFEQYDIDATMVLEVGDQRDAVLQAAGLWENRFDHLRYDRDHDYDLRVLERKAQRRERIQRIVDMFTPGGKTRPRLKA